MTKDAEENRTVAALAYVFFLWVIPLAKKDSPFCRFHARQGIVVFAAWILVTLVGWIPFIGTAAWISLLVVTVMAIWKTLHGETWRIPHLADIAERLRI